MDYGENKRITRIITIYGMVQGVGFRPLIYHLAKKWKLRGYVKNVGGNVEILAEADPEQLENFLMEVKHLPEKGYKIIEVKIKEIAEDEFEHIWCKKVNRKGNKNANEKDMELQETEQLEIEAQETLIYKAERLQAESEDFIILESEESEEVSILPPDLSICSKCQEELELYTNRRWNNAFISCASCGPRYTIIEAMPYDRPGTAMKEFTMCPDCNKEYTSSKDRRFHAQTISCNDCGPYLIYRGRQKKEQEKKSLGAVTGLIGEEALLEAVCKIKEGGILAVKGIGGYHFVCSPFKEATVQRLRRLKGREEKPFAVMFDSLNTIEKYCYVSEEERRLLESKARPIILLNMREYKMAPSTNKGSIYCGAFLPYTPLQVLLTKQCGLLIMTSANQSDQSIIREDNSILALEAKELEGVLYHTRRIVRAVEDSVVKVLGANAQMLRRGRGYAPYPIFLNQATDNAGEYETHQEIIFAAGGDLKAAFCLLHNKKAVVSQYFGDLANASVKNEYEQSYYDLNTLLKLRPTMAVCDLHPNYISSRFAKLLELPVLEVQHHHAHIASVMAEHNLKGKVLGVAFDGTGYGTDGNIWGGEFLICENIEYIRAAHLRYIPLLGGDSAVKDTLKTATCFLISCGLEEYIQDERNEVIKAALKHKINVFPSSSMGRLFDAVASLLGIGRYNQYEGECAQRLEQEAILAERSGILPAWMEFDLCERDNMIEIDPVSVLKRLCQSSHSATPGALALGFHYAVARVISRLCCKLREKFTIRQIALSGGVFQNSLLTEKTLDLLRKDDFEVYLNCEVPPNDGGISLGQAYLGYKSASMPWLKHI